MQIVIEIPKEKYLYAKNLVNGGKEDNPVVLAIGNGTPLPKGHGRLIDASNLLTVTEIREDGTELTYVPYDEIENAETIIKADKGE